MTSKKGINALQIQRRLGFSSYGTAHSMCRKIRTALIEPETKLGDILRWTGRSSAAIERSQPIPSQVTGNRLIPSTGLNRQPTPYCRTVRSMRGPIPRSRIAFLRIDADQQAVLAEFFLWFPRNVAGCYHQRRTELIWGMSVGSSWPFNVGSVVGS
jgi:hypothetical protein